MRRAFITAVFASFIGQAAAQRSTDNQDTLRHPSNAPILIWRNSAAQREGLALINANVHQTNPRLLMPHVACIVDSGARIVVTDGGFFSSTVLVVDGRQAGCRGVVENEMIQRRR